MTRQEFDRLFAATQDTTHGHSSGDLTTINDAVFAAVGQLDVDDDRTKSIVDSAFEREFGSRG